MFPSQTTLFFLQLVPVRLQSHVGTDSIGTFAVPTYVFVPRLQNTPFAYWGPSIGS